RMFLTRYIRAMLLSSQIDKSSRGGRGRKLSLEGLEERCLLSGGIDEFVAFFRPNGRPHEIIAGPDRNLWFNIDFEGLGFIYQITTEGCGVGGFSTGVFPTYGISAGPNGSVWFTTVSFNFTNLLATIGRITPDGNTTRFIVPSRYTAPRGITAGPD